MAWTARRQKNKSKLQPPGLDGSINEPLVDRTGYRTVRTSTTPTRLADDRRYNSSATPRVKFTDRGTDYVQTPQFKNQTSRRVIPGRNSRPVTQQQLRDAIVVLQESLKNLALSPAYRGIKSVGHHSNVRWTDIKKTPAYATLVSVLRLLHISVSVWTTFNTYHCFEHDKVTGCIRHEVDSLVIYDFPELEKNSKADKLLDRHYKVFEKHVDLLETFEDGSFHSRSFSSILMRREETWLKSNPRRSYELVKDFWDEMDRKRIRDYKIIGQLRASIRAQKLGVSRRNIPSWDEEQVLGDILKERELTQRAQDFLYDMAFFSNECIAWWIDQTDLRSPQSSRSSDKYGSARSRIGTSYRQGFENNEEVSSIEVISESFRQQVFDIDQHEERSRRAW